MWKKLKKKKDNKKKQQKKKTNKTKTYIASVWDYVASAFRVLNLVVTLKQKNTK